MKSNSEKVEVYEICLVSIIGIILLIIPGLFLGVFSSGLHLVDDHEILRYCYEYSKGASVADLIKYAVVEDIANRFRPLYMTIKAMLVPILGYDLVLYEILKAIESVIAFVFVYLNVRKLRPYQCSKIVALIFDFVVFVGYQSCIWWKLGTHEIQGGLLFSIGFFLIQKYLESGKKGYAAGGLILFELMIFYKENMFLMLPFVGLYILYLDIYDSKLNWVNIWNAIKKRIVVYIVLIVLVFEALYGCLVIINPNNYKAGEYSITSGLIDLEAWDAAVHHDLKWYSRFGLLFILILCTFFDEIKKYWKELILGFVFIIPQVLVYGTIGMTERYIFPASFGFAYLFVYIPFATGTLKNIRKKIYFLGMLLLCLAHTRVMLREADYYRFRGNGVQATADFIVDTVKENPDAKILTTLDYFESNMTLELYSVLEATDNMYFYHTSELEQPCEPYIDRRFANYSLLNISLERYQLDEMDVIIMYSPDDRHYTYTPDIDVSEFDYKRYGTLDIFVKKSSGIDFPDAIIKPLKINF